MPQLDLIGPQPLSITPAIGVAGPRLWVRRLVIWKEPGGEKIRDISLAPGLNIIWSPDGADDVAVGGQTNAIGHGSGKTLFCRLIRYCLGEDRFATEAQRERTRDDAGHKPVSMRQVEPNWHGTSSGDLWATTGHSREAEVARVRIEVASKREPQEAMTENE